jgi:predicted phosphodiesterase
MPFRRVRVFAVEDTTAQVCWGRLPVGKVVLAAGGIELPVDADGGPGAVVLEGLSPGTRHTLTADGTRIAAFDTLAAPPGRELCRFATVTDLHLGTETFGAVWPMKERLPPGGVPHPLRCARAALRAALEWGAEAIIVKGDVTAMGRLAELVTGAELLAGLPVPVEVVPGNHDLKKGAADMRAVFAQHGITIGYEPWYRDLPGIRVVMGLSAGQRLHGGQVWPDQRETIARLVSAAPGAGFVALHHYPQRFERANVWPPGIPASHAGALLDAVSRANPDTVVSSGHTHRHRRHYQGDLVVTETGSTKDYPGTWTGYVVSEGGSRQVTRRVMDPDCMAWTERTRRAIGGIWGEWSPGPRSHRCFVHAWSKPIS